MFNYTIPLFTILCLFVTEKKHEMLEVAEPPESIVEDSQNGM